MELEQDGLQVERAETDRKVAEAFVRRAVDQADLNALRIALYQATADEVLAAITLDRPTGTAGANGSLEVVRIPDEEVESVKERAVKFLLGGVEDFQPTVPDDAEIRRLMGLLRGEELEERSFLFARDAVGFDEFPRAVEWTDGAPELPTGFRVAVLGAGFSGIAVAVRLQRLGIPYTVYERRGDVGGTWRLNTYPDVRVDTTNFMYQYFFEKKYPWSEHFARGAEVCRYLEHIVEKYDVRDQMEFNSDVTRAVFDEKTSTWGLTVTDPRDGTTREERVGAIVTGVGLFANPRELEIEGAEDFQGEIVHTTRWGEDRDIDGKNVAVIGNGSTGVQLLAQVAERAGHLDVFQRTPQWITPRPRYGEPIDEVDRWLLDTMPYYSNWYTYSMLAEGLGSQKLQEPDGEWQAAGGKVNEANDGFRAVLEGYIRDSLADRPELIDKVTPSYPPMARRLIVDNGWYETIKRDDVELVAEEIERITPNGILTNDGVEHPVDLIIAAVGFETTRYLHPTEYRGVGGVTLEERWSENEGPRAHLGMTVPGFPNMFIVYGPNAQSRSGSLAVMFEVWSSYAIGALVMMIERGKRRIDVRREVYDDYNRRLDERSLELIWVDPESTEKNYYTNEYGRSQVNEPWDIEDYYGWLSEPDPEDFEFS